MGATPGSGAGARSCLRGDRRGRAGMSRALQDRVGAGAVEPIEEVGGLAVLERVSRAPSVCGAHAADRMAVAIVRSCSVAFRFPAIAA